MSVNSIWQKSQDFPQTHACELHLWRHWEMPRLCWRLAEAKLLQGPEIFLSGARR